MTVILMGPTERDDRSSVTPPEPSIWNLALTSAFSGSCPVLSAISYASACAR